MMSLLVIFIFCFILVGCNSPTSDKTCVYGQLIYDNPDSLLQMVNNIDTIGMGVGDKHLYNMMYTAAMYRTGMCVTDTTVINACEDYYKEKEDYYLLALSKLINAESAYNQFDYYKAIEKIIQALDISKDLDNDALKYELYNLLYHINRELECNQRAEIMCNKALEYAVKGGLNNQIVNAYNSMATMLIEQNKFVEAMCYLDSNAKIIHKVEKRNKSEYYRIKGLYFMERDSVSSARDMLMKAEKIMPTAETFYAIAKMYLKLNNLDSCINYCHFTTTADRRGTVSIKAYKIIVENFSNNLNKKTLVRICNDLNNLYLKRGEVGDVSRLERMQSSLDKEEKGNSIWFIGIAVVLILLMTVFVIQHHGKAKKIADGDKLFINESIVYELRKLCKQGRSPSQEQWILLHTAANNDIPFFLNRLYKINDLSAREINICLLTRLHFTPSEISTLIDISPQSVTNTRSRLLGKIFGIKGGATEFDKRIMAMKN